MIPVAVPLVILAALAAWRIGAGILERRRRDARTARLRALREARANAGRPYVLGPRPDWHGWDRAHETRTGVR